MSSNHQGNVTSSIAVTSRFVPRDRRQPLSKSIPGWLASNTVVNQAPQRMATFAEFIHEFPSSTINVTRFSTS
jgi:hypothetical protein